MNATLNENEKYNMDASGQRAVLASWLLLSFGGMSGLLGQNPLTWGYAEPAQAQQDFFGQAKLYPQEIQAGLLQSQLRNLRTLLNSCVIKSDTCDWMNRIALIHVWLLDSS